MELSDHMSLADLRSAIKMFKKDAPKLTSKKSDLMSFAQKVGIMKAKSDEKSEPVAPVPAPKSKKPVTSELPEILKKKTEPKVDKKSDKKSEPAPAPAKKAASSFAQFMSSNKGKGYTMKQLAEMFRAQRG